MSRPAGDTTSMDERPASAEPPEAPPPLLGRWRNLYLVLVGELALLAALFYALTRWAA